MLLSTGGRVAGGRGSGGFPGHHGQGVEGDKAEFGGVGVAFEPLRH